MNNFTLVNADTDSITISKPDGSVFDKKEQDNLLNSLNSLFPELIKWEDDGYFHKVVVLKAKNYILYDGKKIKIKGSALKASTKCPALKEFIKRVIDYMIYNDTVNQSDIAKIYMEYVKEIIAISDIKRWAARKTISETTLKSERTNEAKIRSVIEGTEIAEGDRIYTFYLPNDELELVDRFKGEYHKDRLFRNLYDTAYVFESVLDCDTLFTNYALKKNKKPLQELLDKG